MESKSRVEVEQRRVKNSTVRLGLQTSTLGSQIAELGNSLALELKSRTPTDQNFVRNIKGADFLL